jgi:diguanylate cyclase (GGDEF)-like protein
MGTVSPLAPDERPCILVADDDPDILRLLGMILERDGYRVVSAADGLAALRLAREEQPDLCVLDVSMPGADGYTVCRELQAAGANAPPVIFLTAHAHTTARIDGLDAGAVDYVVKPFERNELKARVRAALRTKSARDALAAEATTDALTGLRNRRELDELADALVCEARENGKQLACLMVDLDHFKSVNDAHGHPAGDAVLREVAARFAKRIRRSDVLARYGGEEFVVLLPDTDAAGALAMAARLRESLEAAPVLLGDGDDRVPIAVRASVGVASLGDGQDAAGLVAEADRALYRAKSLGRDRIELAAA